MQPSDQDTQGTLELLERYVSHFKESKCMQILHLGTVMVSGLIIEMSLFQSGQFIAKILRSLYR